MLQNCLYYTIAESNGSPHLVLPLAAVDHTRIMVIIAMVTIFHVGACGRANASKHDGEASTTGYKHV
jgi:hypothetical protein